MECGVLDTPRERLFDEITNLAAELCDTPVALISLIDEKRQWFKSACGTELKETPREFAFCAHAILGDTPFIVEDAETNPLTFDSPLVTDTPKIRFYAGIPLKSQDGFKLGTLCVIDVKPRKISEREIKILTKLADQASALLQMFKIVRQQAENKKLLKESHDKLSLLSKHIPGVFFQFKMDVNGKYSVPYASEGLREVYRLDPVEVLLDASKIFEIVHPDDIEAMYATVDVSAKRMTPWKHEYRVCFPDGEMKWLSGHSSPIKQEDQSIIWCGYLSDITRQKEMYNQQINTNSKLEAVMNASTQVAVFSCDLDGVITLFNRGAELMLGYKAEDVVGKMTIERFHILSELEEYGRQLSLETGRKISGFDVIVESVRHKQYEKREWTCVRKDGTQLIVELVITGIRDTNNVLTGYLGIASDVTNSKKYKEELKVKQERLELALQGGDLGLWDWNVVTSEVHYDKYWLSVIGVESENISENVSLCINGIHPEDMEDVMQKVNNHFAELTPSYEAEYRYKHRDGHYIWVLARGKVSQRDQYGRPLRMIGTKADITKRKLAEIALKNREQELISARSAAESASRTKSDFLANMSHEIRTPLTAMLGYADLMLDQEVDQETLQNHLGIIKKSGSHLLTIINDILDLSKIESGKMNLDNQRFSPLELIQEVISFFQVRAQSKYLVLNVEIKGKIPETIHSDAVRLRQILINLIGNAIKFTERGSVIIGVSYELKDKPELMIRISDTGIGISEEQIKGLFMPFAQADSSITRKFGGTGLGLTICRRMANLLEGDITVTSQLKVGSTFTVTINPGDLTGIHFIDSYKTVVKENKVQTTSLQLSGKVLLVEDNLDNQRLITMMLKKAGMTVEQAEHGQIAVEKILGNHAHGVELILMDMQMPVMDGCTAISILREQGCELPIISITANAMQEDREKCLSAGADEFLTKPVDRSLLISKCQEWLGKKSKQKAKA